MAAFAPVPFAKVSEIDVVTELGLLNVSVNISNPDLSAAETLLMLSVGALSLSRIVPTPWLSEIVALVGVNKLTLKVSEPSNVESLAILTVMV